MCGWNEKEQSGVKILNIECASHVWRLGGADGEQLLCEIFILFFLYFLLGCLIYVFMSVGSLGRSSKSASARERFSRGVPVRPGATTSARPIKVNLTTYR